MHACFLPEVSGSDLTGQSANQSNCYKLQRRKCICSANPTWALGYMNSDPTGEFLFQNISAKSYCTIILLKNLLFWTVDHYHCDNLSRD